MLDWDSDPELKKLRDEFIASFHVRKQGLMEAIRGISGSGSQKESLDAARMMVHKLAGTAETYGFPTLSRVGEKLEDYLVELGDGRSQAEILGFLKLLDDALAAAIQNGSDPVSILDDPRMKKLTSVVESLPD